MTITITDAFREAVDREEILLFSNDASQLDAAFEPGQPVPAFTAYVWNASADEWFVRFGTALDESTLALLVDLLATPPADWEGNV